MTSFTQLLGLLASALCFAMWWPQAVLVWRGRHDAAALAGVSLGTQVVLFVDEVLWVLHALRTHALWAGAPSLVNAPLALITIVLLRRARAASTKTPRSTGAANS